MRYLMCCVFALAGVVSGLVQADPTEQDAELTTCVDPGLMVVVEGHKASSEDMLQAQEDVSGYITTTKTFLKCLLTNEKTVGDALTYEQKKSSITRYNLAVARMERLIETYNQQLRIYQQANSSED